MAMLSTVTKRNIFSTPLAKHLFPSSFASSPNKDETLVSTAVTILKHHRSKSRWSELHSLTPNLTPLQVSKIILQLHNKPHLALNFFNFTIRRSICSHTLSSYATIIHILARARFKTQALELIKSAIRTFPDTFDPDKENPPRIFQVLVKSYRTCDSAPFVFDLLVKAYLDCKKLDLSVLLVRLLGSRNIFPHVVICNSLIELVSKSKGPFAAYDMYKEIFGSELCCSDPPKRFPHLCQMESDMHSAMLLEDPSNKGCGKGKGNGKEVKGMIANAYTFNILMVAFYREGIVEKVEEVWNEMMVNKCAPNVYSFSVLMAAYCEDENMESAMKVWNDMGDKGVKHDIVAYNTIIEGFSKLGEVERAEEIFREMVFSGVESTCVTLEHLINGHCMIGNVDSALLLYKDMCRKGFKPENSTIDAVAQVLCDKNGVFKALEFVRGVIKKHDIVPRKTVYELLIRSLCQEGQMEEAQKLQAEMVGKGYAPTLETYSAFVDGFIKQGDEKMAETLRNEMRRNKISCKDN